jgi:hypothetical protein
VERSRHLSQGRRHYGAVNVRVLGGRFAAAIWLTSEQDPARLKRLLRQGWSGNVAWSQAAEEELVFWGSVGFTSLCAPISYDALIPDMLSWIHRAEGPGDSAVERLEELQVKMRGCIRDRASGVRVFASDTSDFDWSG